MLRIACKGPIGFCLPSNQASLKYLGKGRKAELWDQTTRLSPQAQFKLLPDRFHLMNPVTIYYISIVLDTLCSLSSLMSLLLLDAVSVLLGTLTIIPIPYNWLFLIARPRGWGKQHQDC